jgi:hypothetical protein
MGGGVPGEELPLGRSIALARCQRGQLGRQEQPPSELDQSIAAPARSLKSTATVFPDHAPDMGVQRQEQDEPPAVLRCDPPGLVHQAEDGRELEASRVECLLGLVRKSFEGVRFEPSPERVDGPFARRPGAEKPDRLIKIAGRREDAGVHVRQSDPSAELLIGLDKVRGDTGNDLVDGRQDQLDDRADRVAAGHVSRAHGHAASVAVATKGERRCRMLAMGDVVFCMDVALTLRHLGKTITSASGPPDRRSGESWMDADRTNDLEQHVTPNDRRSQSAAAGKYIPPSAATTRSVIVALTDSGDLVWSGQDLGPDVVTLQPGAMEYEWCLTVRAAYVPGLLAGLGGMPGDDVVALVAARFKTDLELELFAAALGIPTEFDSWIGTNDDD